MRFNALWCLLLISCNLQAATFSMDLPAVWQQKKVGDVKFVLENFTLSAVHTKSLATQFEDVVNEELKNLLNGDDDGQISVAELESYGVSAEFDAKNMQVEIELEPKALKVDDLTYGDRSYLARPSSAASYAVLNNVNLRYDRNINDSDEFSFEWLGNFNIGGHDGMNGNFSFFHDHSDAGNETYRGDLRLFYDDYRFPLRYEFGDISSFTKGHLPSVNLGGVSFSRSYSELQPLTKISPSNSQEFYLKQSAEVQVIINENVIAKVRLAAGRYDLNDLPLTSGENEVEVLALYNNGTKETFTFSTFYNSQLLSPGLSSFQLSVGYPSTFADFKYDYEKVAVLTGYYEYGINNILTAGANTLLLEDNSLFGVTAILGTSLGNFSVRATHSDTDLGDGYSVSLDTEHTIWGSGPSGTANLRFSYSKTDQFNSTPWQTSQSATTGTNYTLNYNYYINQNFDFNITGRRSKIESGEVSNSGNAQLTWRYQGFRAAVEYRFQDQTSLSNPDRHEVFATFSWSLYNAKNSSRIRTDYNGRADAVRASYAKINRNFHNDYGYTLQGEYSPDVESVSAAASYTGNRFRIDSTSRYQKRDDEKTDDHRVNISTSIGIADGKIGIGNNVRAPFAIITAHSTLADKSVAVNPSPDGDSQAMAGETIGALVNLGTAFTDAALAVEVADAPLGYDWGPGAYNIVGGSATAHLYTIGSDLSYTAIGYLKDEENNPLALQRGTLKGGEINTSFFTNRKGRFVVEGIGSGEYDITVEGRKAKLIIPETDKSLIRVGIVKLYSVAQE